MRLVLPAADTLDNELIHLLHTMSGEDTVSENLHSYQVLSVLLTWSCVGCHFMHLAFNVFSFFFRAVVCYISICPLGICVFFFFLPVFLEI